MSHPQQHHHIRERIYKNLEPYPSPDPLKRFFDKVIFSIAILGPLMTIPQVLQIWITKNAAGVSLLSWSAFFIFSIFWLLYGIVHKEKPIILANLLGLFVQGIIIIGILSYT